MEAARGCWDIRMVFQPPNLPDKNILDLGCFAVNPIYVSKIYIYAKDSPQKASEGKPISG
jgi:hypothetical protein